MRFNIGDKIWFKEWINIENRHRYDESFIGYGHSGVIKSIFRKSDHLSYTIDIYPLFIDREYKRSEIFTTEKTLLIMLDKSKTRGEIINKLLDEV